MATTQPVLDHHSEPSARKFLRGLALVVLAMLTPLGLTHAQTATRTLVALFAHPDDEVNGRLAERLAQEIVRLKPDVVVTWGPDGGTGHPDHRMVSNIATQLARAGAPAMPERLFYMSLPAEMVGSRSAETPIAS